VTPIYKDLSKDYFGVKQIGEMSMALTAPSIANAIHDATGSVVEVLPLTPERIFFLIQHS